MLSTANSDWLLLEAPGHIRLGHLRSVRGTPSLALAAVLALAAIVAALAAALTLAVVLTLTGMFLGLGTVEAVE